MSNKRRPLAFLMLGYFLISLDPLLATPLPKKEISESELKKIMKENSGPIHQIPELGQWELQHLQAIYHKESEQDRYAPQLFAEGAYQKTREKGLFPQQPVLSPTYQTMVGVNKALPLGMNVSAGLAPNSVGVQGEEIKSIVGEVKVNMDLWQNLLGKLDQARMKKALIQEKKATINQEIKEHAYLIQLRKLYWNWVAKEESLKILKELHASAVKQRNEAQARLANALTDEGEVARFKSLVAQREGSMIYLRFQIDQIKKQLSQLLPPLATFDLQLTSYDVSKAIKEVTECTSLIATQQTLPLNYTQYDEILGMLQGQLEQEQLVASAYDKPHVQFSSALKTTGRNAHFSGALDDGISDNRLGYEVGLKVTIPLGQEKQQTQKAQLNIQRQQFTNSKNEIETQLLTTHKNVVTSIHYLNQVIEAQKQNGGHLKVRLQTMNRKFHQARVSLTELITEEDSYLNNELQVIDTQLAVLNTLFDYFMIFDQTPCDFNNI